MSAKFLHVFIDENPELQKQIGCMTGIFQMFDRQNLTTGRRLINSHPHKSHPTGHAGAEHGASSLHIAPEMNHTQNLNVHQRISMESSRTSFSSSSGSSYSSLDCNKSSQQESLPFEKTFFQENSSKNLTKLNTINADVRPPRNEVCKSLDFPDVVKDSFNRDSQGLSAKTSPREEVKNTKMQHSDSPRPMPLPRSRETVDLDESLRVLVKLKEAPWNFSGFGESPRSSFYSESWEAHRLYFYGREISHQSLDPRDDMRLSSKLQELPRLSLDSRESSMRNFNFETKFNSILNDFDGNNDQKAYTASNAEQELVSHKCSTSVVAKLMGLEAMPYDPSIEQRPKRIIIQDNTKDRISDSPKRPFKISDSKMKPLSNSKVPIESAPWKRQKGKHEVLQKATCVHHESMCSEIEKRLKELEFWQCNDELKQILDAMQEKGLLGSDKSDEKTTKDHQNLGSGCTLNQKISPLSRTRGTFESPIVIMKPANFVKRSGVSPPSVMDKKKASDDRVAKDQSFCARLKELSHMKSSNKIEDKGSLRTRSKTEQVSSRPQPSPRENDGSIKTSVSLSPRLQQRRFEAERSQPPLPSSDSSQLQKFSTNRKQGESVSPRNKFRQKPGQVQDNDERLSKRKETQKFNNKGKEISQKSDIDVSSNRSTNNSVFQQGSRSPSGKAARKAVTDKKQKKPSINLKGEVRSTEFVTVPPEQPSSVSVLDASINQDDLPPSPLKKSLNSLKADETKQTRTSSSEINEKKLRSIDNLLQKLTELSSTDDKLSTTDHITSLCKTKNPDHRYISEILLASGLLLKDLSAGPMGPSPIQLHSSGHPINPDLFFVLEQTKTGWLPKPETTLARRDKLHRKLMFDLVNVILTNKLEHNCSGQQLLKDMCFEIDLLSECCDDQSKIANEEVLRGSKKWGDFDKDVSGLVLEIERLIFKDLIGEVVY